MTAKKLVSAPTSDIVTMAPDNSEVGALALVTLDPAKYVAEVFKPFRTRLAVLVDASEAAKLEAPDLRTVAGMAIAIKHRAGFRDDVRIDGEAARIDRKAPLLKIGKLLDSEYKEVAAEALPHETYWDVAIKAEEKRKAEVKAEAERLEAERLAAIRAKIEEIRALPGKSIGADSVAIRAVLTELATRELVEADFDKLFGEASLVLEVAGQELSHMLVAAVEREKIEADRLAAIEAERVKVAQQVEANRVEAARLEKLRVEAELAETERKRLAAIEQARIDGIAAEAQRKLNEAAELAQAETNRLADERAAFDAEKLAFAKAQEAARTPVAVEAVQSSVEAEETQPEAVCGLVVSDSRSAQWSATEIAAMQASTVAPMEFGKVDPAHELRALIDAVPDAYAEQCVSLCSAVRDLLHAGMTADGVRALVESELLA